MPNILGSKIENREVSKMGKENNLKRIEAQTQRNKKLYKQNLNSGMGKFEFANDMTYAPHLLKINHF